MTVVQSTTMFNFYLLAYMVTTFEQVYLAQFVGLLSELVSTFTAGLVMNKLGTKRALITFYSISGFGAIMMIFYGLSHTDSLAFPAIYSLCRFGTCGVYVIMIAANARIFYVENAASAFGFGSFFTQLACTAAPLVAIISQPTPMVIFAANVIFALLASLLLKLHPEAENYKTSKSEEEKQKNLKLKDSKVKWCNVKDKETQA